MKGYIFLLAVIVLLVVAYNYKVEGFKTEIVIPNKVPQPQSIDASSPDPYMEPAEKEYGPPLGDLAKVNSLPYRDPAQEKTNYKNLAELKESLSGFINYEAKGLQENSDPSIQLPLTTLRSDYQRVSDEVDVLKRNPGIDSDMTIDSANEIRANLAYLQKKYRLSVNSDIGEIEGFEDTGARATLQDLKDALSKIKAEILRMSVSGTTDPVLNARVNVLTKMSQKVKGIIDDVNRGARTPDQIPIMKSDLKDFLTKSGDVSSPVTNFVHENSLPPTLANLFPAYQAGDISGARITQYLFNKYADTVVKGLSWNVGLKYTSPNEAAAGGSGASTTISGTGLDGAFESISDAIGSTGAVAAKKNTISDFSSPSNFARGEFEATTNPSSRTSGYDWKEKSTKICEAIRSRGLNPGDFGCLESTSSVGSDYSWRGNARMVCTRLQASYDPGLPDYCGCPPVEWAGWRS
jgi:hypothetical protein